MATREPRSQLPLIVVVGPTASGKTALAIKLAQRYEGEIICADSRTVYRGMDVGTAKPTVAERANIPHWGLDLVEPGDRFSASDFQQYAHQKINEIRRRGKVPFLVGGTGLYTDAVLFEYTFGGRVADDTRQLFDTMTLEQLYDYCIKYNISLPQDIKNKRRVVRAAEVGAVLNKRNERPISTSIIVGIATDRTELRTRIEQRSEQLFNNGVVEEAMILGKKYGWNNEAMTGNIYPLVHTYQEGGYTLEEVKNKFTTLDWQLAKRQLTWFRRNSYIVWGNRVEIENYVANRLASHSTL